MAGRKFQDTMPLAPLKIVALGNCEEIGKKIDSIIVQRRKEAYGRQISPHLCLRIMTVTHILLIIAVLVLEQAKGKP